jgi:hypothetical protein
MKSGLYAGSEVIKMPSSRARSRTVDGLVDPRVFDPQVALSAGSTVQVIEPPQEVRCA